jgi:hypothetical protein
MKIQPSKGVNWSHQYSLKSNFNQDLFPTGNKVYNRTVRGHSVKDLLSSLSIIQENFLSYDLISKRGQARETNEYRHYLAPHDNKIKSLAMSITDTSDSNDEKMYKIEQWVYNNIDYQYDSVNYGSEEYWAEPAQTLRKGSGDCEDHAFLIHSLGLNAGVDPDRLRTYGGVVAWQNEEGGLSAGGHGWTAYRKESDDKWTILDTTFFVTDKPLDQRLSLENNMKYVEDYFFVNLNNTVDTPMSNGIRNPEEHTGYAKSEKYSKPSFIDFFV